MKHLTDIKDLSAHDIEQLFEQANVFKTAHTNSTKQLHAGRSAMALFFENSTRTLTSFQLACQRLGIDMVALNIAHSSTQKGETIRDTLLTLDAMQSDLFIVRHQQNHIQQDMINWLNNTTSIINAGDGTNQHPTQGLLDLYTIYQHKKDFKQLKVAIIGDIKHSRVANSLVDGLNIMGAGEVNLFAPDFLIPDNKQQLKASCMKNCLQDADVVVMLRIQKERFTDKDQVSFEDWHQHYGLNEERLAIAKKDA
ncbi:MAG: aspartate carbamoyltransferase catalytic subunit, partial [Xanthomonadales bacterium]|nr:aspartate carbamoyltransferase catalytic subunit [Xanthomonadales bacterium]